MELTLLFMIFLILVICLPWLPSNQTTRSQKSRRTREEWITKSYFDFMRKLNKISSEFFNKCPEDKELSEMINRVGSEIKKSIKTLQGNQEEEIEKHYLNFKLKLVEISSDFLNKCPENKEILGMIDRIGSEIDRPLLIAKMRF